MEYRTQYDARLDKDFHQWVKKTRKKKLKEALALGVALWTFWLGFLFIFLR